VFAQAVADRCVLVLVVVVAFVAVIITLTKLLEKEKVSCKNKSNNYNKHSMVGNHRQKTTTLADGDSIKTIPCIQGRRT
jgi:hypothetical protein